MYLFVISMVTCIFLYEGVVACTFYFFRWSLVPLLLRVWSRASFFSEGGRLYLFFVFSVVTCTFLC